MGDRPEKKGSAVLGKGGHVAVTT
jgi:hypothetical protein